MRKLAAAAMAAFWSVCIAYGCAAGGDTDEDTQCPVGSEGCKCTTGGACDPGLQCLSSICVDPNNPTGSGGGGTGGGTGTGGQDCVPDGEGCQAVDVLFALDSSGSMNEENAALSATQAFKQVVDTIAAINCGQVDFRIGITNDNVPQFYSAFGSPWFDSGSMTNDDIAAAFTASANTVIGSDSASLGCEHVLSNSVDLLNADSTGFLREGALLVLVLVTDVDDFGVYDQPSGNSCGLGCAQSGQAVATLYNTLLTLKADEPKAIATIVIAGDPSSSTPDPLCGQPQACGSNAFIATRLYDFANTVGAEGFGVTANICAGAAAVPGAVQAAFDTEIDLACQQLEPPK